MAYRFVVDSDSDSSPPSTPDRGSTKRGSSDLFHFDDNPSTTPAGPPPPSSAASFTPAGAPSASYLGSSMMRGVTAQKPASFGSRLAGSGAANKTLFAPKTNSPLGRSIQASAPSAAGKGGRQPSKLSKQFVMSSDEDEDQEEEDQEDDERDAEGDEEDDYPQQLQQDMRSAKDSGPRTFSVRYEDSDEASDAQGEDDLGSYRREDGLGADADAMGEEDVEGDLWLGLDAAADEPMIGDESDLMMMATPAVNDRIRREAEDIFRASAMRSTNRPPREFKFAPIAKAIYDQMGYATITESPEVIIETENLVGRLYNEGVGPEEDANRMDNTLAGTSAELASVWRAYVESMPRREEEHSAGVGPGPNASAFENASYLASLALQVHHTRFDDGGEARLEPLTETMFRWLAENHNLYPGQVRDVLSHQPAPAGHSMFWQTVFVALLQGRVTDALDLLSRGGWDRVRRGHQAAYTGQALANVERAVHETWDMLSGCPGRHGNWEIWSSDWMLFRIRAKGFLEQLRRFAEGRDRGGGGDAEMFRGRNSMAGLARKAESQVPWEIYENLNIIFDIVLGVRERIVAMAQDWCEATVALFGWWDEGSRAQQQPQLLSRSQSLVLASDLSSSESYLDRLARSFQAAVGAGLELNSNNPLEVGMACVFEDNPKGVIGILRGWSLPVASAVAEIASLGGWLPPHQPSLMFGMDDLDMDDLEVLGVDPKSPDELDGIKDHTLVQYAQELVNLDELATVTDKSGRTMEGWELAIHVLGRMESPERSEETVGELVRTILEGVDVGSGATVEKVWRLLNDLGMIAFAEETAEHYGDTLAQDSHRYGEAMWYYALAHRPSKVREVMNLLISYSLVQSAAYPPEPELDGYLARLLSDRNATLQRFAKQDLEAAELLGKLLSGYATLRRFYELRDDDGGNDNDGGGSGGPSASLSSRRSAAAVALTAVIASSGDNIRGGIYDAGRGAVVSEDFLLALLGEALMFVDVEREQPALTLEHIDVLLKAVEDLSSLGGSSRVRAACDEFLGLVLQSAKGLRGAGPADLARSMRKSTSGSYVLGGSSMLASQLHRSIVGGPGGGAGGAAAAARRRGWDWRTDERAGVRAGMGGDELLAKLRLGLARDLGRLWVAEADGAI